jgi:hypothetical protein
MLSKFMKALTEFFGNNYSKTKEEPKFEVPAELKVEPPSPKPSTAQKPKPQRKKRNNGSNKQTSKKQ